jgi:hypothetical protein
MKQVARKFMYWKGINEDIEKFVGEFESCQILRKDYKKKSSQELGSSNVSLGEDAHVFFPFSRKNFPYCCGCLHKVDGNRADESDNSRVSSKGLRPNFWKIVSDNGSLFGSCALRMYLEKRRIKFTHSPPYNPQSNGMAERAVQTAKSVLRKYVNDYKNQFQITEAVIRLLYNYRNLPATKDEIVPSHRMFSYKPKWKITSLKYKKRVSFEEEERYDLTNHIGQQRVVSESNDCKIERL